MASTEFGTNDAQTVKRWGTELMTEVMERSFVKRLMGTGPDSVVQRLTDLDSGAGDTIKYDLLTAMRSDGVQGDSQLEDYEEEMNFAQDEIKIDQLRNASDFMTMTQQRTLHNLRSKAKSQLAEWNAWKLDTMTFAYLAGTAGDGPENAAGTIGSGFAGNSLVTPDTAHYIDHVSSPSTFKLQYIHDAVTKAKTINPRLRPAIVDGEKKFCLIMHPYTVNELKQETGDQAWSMIHARIAENGSNNPIYNGAIGEVNGVVLHESEHIPITFNSGSDWDCSSLFLGAQAGTIAFGNAHGKGMGKGLKGGRFYKWHEQVRDYDNKKGVAVSSIFGVKKTRFTVDGTPQDFGVIRIDTRDAAPS